MNDALTLPFAVIAIAIGMLTLVVQRIDETLSKPSHGGIPVVSIVRLYIPVICLLACVACCCYVAFEGLNLVIHIVGFFTRSSGQLDWSLERDLNKSFVDRCYHLTAITGWAAMGLLGYMISQLLWFSIRWASKHRTLFPDVMMLPLCCDYSTRRRIQYLDGWIRALQRSKTTEETARIGQEVIVWLQSRDVGIGTQAAPLLSEVPTLSPGTDKQAAMHAERVICMLRAQIDAEFKSARHFVATSK